YQNDTTFPSYADALSQVRADSHLSSLFEPNSWQEKMVAECRSSLHTHPSRAKAVLFYSQHPDGRPDKRSKHGGCPVLDDGGGEQPKWAANLWVWNAPRMGYPEAPNKEGWSGEKAKKSKSKKVKEGTKKEEAAAADGQKLVVFANKGGKYVDAKLYYEDTYWGDLGEGDSHRVNSFAGHVWRVKAREETVEEWTVGSEPEQSFNI
ncbi:hypothetical protein TeGR_g3804, partial [Tetraparma gracilis]